MNPYDPIKSFDHFVGKICSIHTIPTNWKLSTEEVLDYYVGIVNSVNECGICLTNVVNQKKTFIFTPAIVAIAEETVVDRDDPDSENMLKEYREKKKDIFQYNPKIVKTEPAAPVVKDKPLSPFVDISSITKLAAKKEN